MNFDSYEEIDFGISIHFRSPDMDLREVGIVCGAVHRVVNKVLLNVCDLNEQHLMLSSSARPNRKNSFGYTADPLLASLTVTELKYGSLSAKTKIKVQKNIKAIAIGAVGSLLATVLISVFEAAPNRTTLNMGGKLPAQRSVDVGKNIANMVNRLSMTGKPWELTIRDEQTGHSVVIKSK